jgi:hypothetical protein
MVSVVGKIIFTVEAGSGRLARALDAQRTFLGLGRNSQLNVIQK